MPTSPHPLHPLRHVFVALWGLAFLAFHLPWTTHPTAAFTQNGFDLAEQIGIHPVIQTESPPLLSAGYLRSVSVVVAFGLALVALLYHDLRLRWVLRGLAVLVALRNIPPQSAFRNPGSIPDEAYLSQLTLLTLLAGVLVLLTLPQPFQKVLCSGLAWVLMGLCVLGIILPMAGLNTALWLLEEIGLNIEMGGGGVLYGLALAGIAGLTLLRGGRVARSQQSRRDRVPGKTAI
ncbi:MAG: hypothetical protein HC915_02490 [Anaerolineae bacterium]|nr:hypothetical protein [Anaerolineae bacterium]